MAWIWGVTIIGMTVIVVGGAMLHAWESRGVRRIREDMQRREEALTRHTTKHE